MSKLILREVDWSIWQIFVCIMILYGAVVSFLFRSYWRTYIHNGGSIQGFVIIGSLLVLYVIAMLLIQFIRWVKHRDRYSLIIPTGMMIIGVFICCTAIEYWFGVVNPRHGVFAVVLCTAYISIPVLSGVSLIFMSLANAFIFNIWLRTRT